MIYGVLSLCLGKMPSTLGMNVKKKNEIKKLFHGILLAGQGNQAFDLVKHGLTIELCGATATVHKWGSADLLPGVKVNTDPRCRECHSSLRKVR